MIKTFAAIDIGSYELELVIFEISPKNGICEVEHMRQVVALGKDAYTQGKITYEHIDALCQKLLDFSKVMTSYKVEDYRAYATSALREAQNNQIVLDQIRVRTGLKVSILSNSEERLLGYRAIASKEQEFPEIIKSGTAILDVSFGSVQLSLFDEEAMINTQNLRIGVLRIREMIHSFDCNSSQIETLVEELIDSDLLTFKKMYLKDREIKNVIVIGDCIKYFIRYSMKAMGLNRINRLSVTQFMELYAQLASMSADDIEEFLDIPVQYLSLMKPSAIIYKRILEITGGQTIFAPGTCLGDGIAAAYANDKQLIVPSHDFTEDILIAARNIGKRYQGSRNHSLLLEANALKIFDATKKIHGLSKRERLLLQIAATLHDCGKYISMRHQEECSYNIIMSTEIIGLSHREREIIANVVRYHNTKYPYYERTEGKLDKGFYLVIAKLIAILQISIALDKTHKEKLKDSKVRVKDLELLINTNSNEDLTIERGTLEQRADFFEEIYGIRPVLKQKRRF